MGHGTATSAAVQDYIDFLRDGPPLEDIETRLVQFVRAFGFDHLAYTVIRMPRSRRVSGFFTRCDEGNISKSTAATEFIETDDEQDDFIVDPLFKAAWSTCCPFRWDHLEQTDELSRRKEKLFGGSCAATMHSGMTIPLHGPEQGLAALSLTGHMTSQDFDTCWRNYRMDLFTVAAYTHEVIVASASRTEGLPNVHLSGRELECLRWTSRGKTTWEIAQILTLSQDTTRFYLREATRKFGVHSKHHAVVKAIAAGFIAP